MDNLKPLILSHEDWLIDRVVHYARVHDYTPFTSTLREAWRASIVGLSRPLVAALEESRGKTGPIGQPLEAAVAFGVEQARKHRRRGTGLAMFLGLLKLYRRTYFDLVEEKLDDPEARRKLTGLLLEMFDSIELGLTREWSHSGETEELARLRQMTRELSNEKNRFLTVLESIAEPVILLDPDDRPRHINAAGAAILLGETSPGASYYRSEDTEGLTRLVTEILVATTRDCEAANQIALQTATGERSFSIAIQEMLDISEKFAGRVIILNDVTDYLTAIAAAEEANHAKSAFLATVSHEIKTPINSIVGLTEILDDGSLTEAQAAHLDGIRASGNLLGELTENILGLSRAEANALRRVDQDFDLCELIQTLRPVFAPEAAKRGLELRVEIAPEVPCQLHGDAGKLRHVLMNLVSNALKFTSQGSVTLRAQVSGGMSECNPTIRFEVADTGVGLPSGGIDWLFSPFTQYAHPSIDVMPRGTGLGLAICKRMVDFLGGRISAGPNPGGGSVFWFEVALEAARAPTPQPVTDRALAVLVVEDDAVNAMVAEGLLADLGHRPVIAPSYNAALEALHRQSFDLVLTDHRLDGATGLDLAAHLRHDANPALKQLPVILITAAIPPEASDAHDRDDVQLFVEKPITRHDLDQAIRRVMAAAPVAGPADAGSSDKPESSPEAANSAPPLLDRKVLNRLLTDLGIERSDRIVASFRSSAPGMCKALVRGMASEDLGLVTKTAHQMISAAGYVGLPAVAELARRLHASGTARDIRSARRQVHELCPLVERSTAALATQWPDLCTGYGVSA